MDSTRSVALVGRPNVGKSRLFNRLAGRRIAIVHDQPGVTRDVNAVTINNDFMLMDTGGIGLVLETQNLDLIEAIEKQVFFAIQAASVILLVVDGKEGCTPLDEMIVEKLRRFGKESLLVINKIDRPEHEDRMAEFAHLGLKKSLLVSAEHGRGIADLHKSIEDLLGPGLPEGDQEERHRVRICFVGRPNAGKSSLCNRLLQSDRLVVSEFPGTTRDAVELNLDYKVEEEIWPFRLIDTAGLRKRGRVSNSVEYFSTVRAGHAMEKADVVFLVLDARFGVTKQDKSLAGRVIEAGKAHAVVVNKWDLTLDLFQNNPSHLYDKEEDFRRHFARALQKEIFFMPNSPVLFVSALTGYGMEDILPTAHQLDTTQSRTLPTPSVNHLIMRLFERQRPRLIKRKRFKIYYAVQTGQRPLRIRFFCNEPTHLDKRYRRYLESGFISEFDLKGCPVRFELVGKPSRAEEYYVPQKVSRFIKHNNPPCARKNSIHGI